MYLLKFKLYYSSKLFKIKFKMNIWYSLTQLLLLKVLDRLILNKKIVCIKLYQATSNLTWTGSLIKKRRKKYESRDFCWFQNQLNVGFWGRCASRSWSRLVLKKEYIKWFPSLRSDWPKNSQVETKPKIQFFRVFLSFLQSNVAENHQKTLF